MSLQLPLAPDDLRAIADQVDGLTAALIDANGEYKPFTGILAGSVPFVNPEDPTTTLGRLVFEDGWIAIEFDKGAA